MGSPSKASSEDNSGKIKKTNRNIIIAAVVVFLIICIGASGKSDSTNPTSTASPEATATATPEPTPAVSKEFENALSRAKSYLSIGNWSEEGLKHQLEFDKFGDEAVAYAMKNCEADWDEEAVGAAKTYYGSMNMSKEGVKDQLAFDKFTDKQIEYALSKL